MPSFEDALAGGGISAGHVDAIAAATRNLNDQLLAEFVACEAALLADAGNQRVETFERNCRDLARYLAAQHQATSDAEELDKQRNNSSVKRWTDKAMRNTLLSLDPLRDAELWTAVNAKLASLRQADGNNATPWAQFQVNAFIATGDAVSRVPQVGVLIDFQTICDGLHAHSICELDNGTPIPVSTVRRLCCDAKVFPVVLGADGEVLDVGQAARTATPAQTQGTPSDAPHLRPSRVHRHDRRVPDASPRVLPQWRINIDQQHAPIVRDASSPRPRRRMAIDNEDRSGGDLATTRWHDLAGRINNRPATQPTTTTLPLLIVTDGV